MIDIRGIPIVAARLAAATKVNQIASQSRTQARKGSQPGPSTVEVRHRRRTMR
jgi:hypothetical protein